jgi:hypothetical protein
VRRVTIRFGYFSGDASTTYKIPEMTGEIRVRLVEE